jgi:hypothetical protein
MLLGKYNFNPNDFGLHSMRAGGATDALRASVPPHVIDKQGRWKSTYTKYRYFRSSESEHVREICKTLQY